MTRLHCSQQFDAATEAMQNNQEQVSEYHLIF
jgi:hypothetical protein